VLFAQYYYILDVGEFYPSMSLPRAGAAPVRDGVENTAERWLLFAVTQDGLRLHVDEHQLLSTMSSSYRSPIIERGFGLLPESSTTPEEAAEARAWLDSRLRRQLQRDDLVALEMVKARYTPSSTPGPKPYLALLIRSVEL
jgi:hypothetical protein